MIERIIKVVMLMVSENLHVNLFMYEPILGIPDTHLNQLYSDIRVLGIGIQEAVL